MPRNGIVYHGTMGMGLGTSLFPCMFRDMRCEEQDPPSFAFRSQSQYYSRIAGFVYLSPGVYLTRQSIHWSNLQNRDVRLPINVKKLFQLVEIVRIDRII